jgi:hypothetical protein
MLSQQAIMEYQKLFRQTYGKEISYEQAMEQGEKLIQLVQAVLRPIPLTELDVYQGEVNKKCQ